MEAKNRFKMYKASLWFSFRKETIQIPAWSGQPPQAAGNGNLLKEGRKLDT